MQYDDDSQIKLFTAIVYLLKKIKEHFQKNFIPEA